MTQKIKKICLAFCLLASQSMMSQDVLYSQFNYNPVNLNPGFAGTGKNNLRLSALSKVQWLNLYKPFKYFSGAVDFSAYDYNERNVFNGALNITNSNKGYLSNTNISGVVGRSFGTNTVDCSNWFLSIALQAGYNFAKVDPNKFVFIDQIDQTGYTGNASEVDLFYTNNTKNYFDFSSGFVFTFKDFMIGGSVHHLNEPNTSFNGKPEDGKMPKKITGHLSYLYEGEAVKLKPTILTQFQGNSKILIAGALIDYYDFPIEFGCWYRNAIGLSNNSTFSIGFTWKWGESSTVTSRTKEFSNKLGLSYDADIYGPSAATTHGGIEFGIQKDVIINDNRYCPTSTSGQCDYRFPWEFF